jgi:hypothetical protein
MSESSIQTSQGLRMLESCAAGVFWLAILGHPNDYNAFKGIIMALYFRCGYVIDGINVEWGYNLNYSRKVYERQQFWRLGIVIRENVYKLNNRFGCETTVTGRGILDPIRSRTAEDWRILSTTAS